MRVRCTFCGADYEAPVTRAALGLVARCEYCRRERLESADEGAPSADRVSRLDPSAGPAPVRILTAGPP